MADYDTFLHSHGLFSFITIILFLLTMSFIYSGKQRPAKIFQMILRGLYILVLITGSALIFLNLHIAALIKGVLSFWLIYVMEMIATRRSKNELSFKMAFFLWLQFAVSLCLVLYIGYSF